MESGFSTRDLSPVNKDQHVGVSDAPKAISELNENSPLDERFYQKLEDHVDQQYATPVKEKVGFDVMKDSSVPRKELHTTKIGKILSDATEKDSHFVWEDTGLMHTADGKAFFDTDAAGMSTSELDPEFITQMYEVIDVLPEAHLSEGILQIGDKLYASKGVAGKGGMAEAVLFQSEGGESLIVKNIDLTKDNGFSLEASLYEMEIMDTLEKKGIANIPRIVSVLDRNSIQSNEFVQNLSIVMSYEGKTLYDLNKGLRPHLVFEVLKKCRQKGGLEKLNAIVAEEDLDNESMKNLFHYFAELDARIKIAPEEENILLEDFSNRWQESLATVVDSGLLSKVINSLALEDRLAINAEMLENQRVHSSFQALKSAAQSLGSMHEAGYVHGDISRKNITEKVNDSGEVKGGLIDFGLVKRMKKYDKMGETKGQKILNIADAIERSRSLPEDQQAWKTEMYTYTGTPNFVDPMRMIPEYRSIPASVDARLPTPLNDIPGLARVAIDTYLDNLGIDTLPNIFELKVRKKEIIVDGVKALKDVEHIEFSEQYFEFIMTMLRSVKNESGKQLLPESFFRANYIGKNFEDKKNNPQGLYRQEQIAAIRPKAEDLIDEMEHDLMLLDAHDIEILRNAMVELNDFNRLKRLFNGYQKQDELLSSMSDQDADDTMLMRNLLADIGNPFPYYNEVLEKK